MQDELYVTHNGVNIHIKNILSKHEALKVEVNFGDEYYTCSFKTPVGAMLYLHRTLLENTDCYYSPTSCLDFVEGVFDLIEMRQEGKVC